MDPRGAGASQPPPAGATVTAATARGLLMLTPEPVAAGALLEFDLLLGARPLHLTALVQQCRPLGQGFRVDAEFVGMTQGDRDSLVDFLQAVGSGALRVRPHRP